MNENDELTIQTEKGEETLSREEFNNRLPKTFDIDKQRNYVLDLLMMKQNKEK